MALAHPSTSIRRLVLGSIAIAAVAVAVVPRGADAAPATPPTIASVNDQLTSLGRQQEQLSERFNLARAEVATKQKQTAAAQEAADKTAADFAVARNQLRALITEQYEQASFSSAGALLSSRNGENYLEKMSQLDLLASHRGDVVSQLDSAKAAADAAQKQVAQALKDARATQAAVTAQRASIEAQKAKFQTLLATLTAQQQRAFANRNAVPIAVARAAVAQPPSTLPSVHAGSAAAQKAVDFALAQVGKPYVYAASGPDAFDCSGLTMAAWAQAGVSLPHNAEAQYGYGTHVSLDALQPGDLVFMYSPIGHVEIYIGNGLAVSAPQEGENVKVINVASPDDVGATRLT